MFIHPFLSSIQHFYQRQNIYSSYGEEEVHILITFYGSPQQITFEVRYLEYLAAIALILPVTIATVERNFNEIKLLKTRSGIRLSGNASGAVATTQHFEHGEIIDPKTCPGFQMGVGGENAPL